ncbi:cullin, conserved site-containing protein [Tanacetum coccineum]
MTSIFVPSDRLVSPLNESLLCLTKEDRILETKVALPVNQLVDASSSRHEEVKLIKVKEVNSRVKYKEAKKNVVPVKERETKGECVKDELFCPDFTSKESRESVKHKKKVGWKVSQGIDELPSERKNKLTGVQSTDISSSELVKLRSCSRLSLGAIKDKSGIKCIVKCSKWKNVERNESYAVGSDAQQTEVAPAEAASHDNWIACDRCNAWRLLLIGITVADMPEKWWCSKSTWLPGKNYCDVSQDETTQAVREMNFKISSQNHVIGDTYHTNSNANSSTMPNGWKKNKSRPEGSNSNQVETSHSSMDSRQKRKRLSEANQQLLEKNVVNKAIDVGRNDATVNELYQEKLMLKVASGLKFQESYLPGKITCKSVTLMQAKVKKLGGKVELKRKESSELTSTTGTQSGKGSLLRSKDKDEKSTIQRVKLKAPALLTEHG